MAIFLYSTLRYANRAKNIKNKPRINEDPKDALLRQYQEEIQQLKLMLLGRMDVPPELKGKVPRVQIKYLINRQYPYSIGLTFSTNRCHTCPFFLSLLLSLSLSPPPSSLSFALGGDPSQLASLLQSFKSPTHSAPVQPSSSNQPSLDQLKGWEEEKEALRRYMTDRRTPRGCL